MDENSKQSDTIRSVSSRVRNLHIVGLFSNAGRSVSELITERRDMDLYKYMHLCSRHRGDPREIPDNTQAALSFYEANETRVLLVFGSGFPEPLRDDRADRTEGHGYKSSACFEDAYTILPSDRWQIRSERRS